MCLWMARICYAVSVTSNILYALLNIFHGIDVTLFRLVVAGLPAELLWILVHKEFKKAIGGIMLTAVS